MKPLEYAKQWAEAGYYVFPVIPNGKIPLIRDGFKGASNKPEDVADWITAFPEANYGIACGASGLVVLDFDKKNGGLESVTKVEEVQGGQALHTYGVATPGGGYHFYYVGVSPSRAGILPGFDIRGDGGYVVGPGSAIDGNTYEPLHPDCPVEKLPEVLQQFIARPVVKHVTDITGERGALNKRTLRFVAEGALPGQWHQELFQAAMNCKQNNYSFDDCVDLLRKATGTLDETHDIPLIIDVYTKRSPMYEPDLQSYGEAIQQEDVGRAEPIFVKASELLEDSLAYCNDKELISGTPLGIKTLDSYLGGGIRWGEVIGVLASRKVGKSSFTHKIIHSYVTRTLAVGYASRELRPATEVLPNLFSIEFQKNVLTKGLERTQATETLAKWPLYFAPGLGHFPIEEAEQWMVTLNAMGVRLFILDHLIHMVGEEDHKLISNFVRKLKALAQRLHIGIILVMQPRNLQEGERVSARNIRGSSSIAEVVDGVVVLEREKGENNRPSNVTKVRLDVHRHKLACLGELYLEYDRDTMDFTEVEVEDPSGTPEPTESPDTGPVFDNTKAGRAMETKRLDS